MASANDQNSSAKRPGHLVDVSRDAELGPEEQTGERGDWEARVRPSSRQVSVLVDPSEYERLHASAEPALPDAAQRKSTHSEPAGPTAQAGEAQDLDAFVAQLDQQPTARQYQQQIEADVDAFDQLAAQQPGRAPATSTREGTATAPRGISTARPQRQSPSQTGGHKTGRVLAGSLAVLVLAGAGAAIATSGSHSRRQTPAAARPTKATMPPLKELGQANNDVRQLGKAAAAADAQGTAAAESRRLTREAHQAIRLARKAEDAAPRDHQTARASVRQSSEPASDATSAQTPPATTAETPNATPPASPSAGSSTSTAASPSSSTTAASNSGLGSSKKAFGYGGLLGSGHSGG